MGKVDDKRLWRRWSNGTRLWRGILQLTRKSRGAERKAKVCALLQTVPVPSPPAALLPLKAKEQDCESQPLVCESQPLVPEDRWQQLPPWIALHAERGKELKCYNGCPLKAQHIRTWHLRCRDCELQLSVGKLALVCTPCAEVVCTDCVAAPRVPELHTDQLFHGANNPSLLVPVALNQKHGVVIVCPGGNYEFLCPNEGLPIAAWLRGLGIQAVVLRYRLLPRFGLEDALDDLTAAIALMRQSGNGRVAALGFSAGAHLATSIAVRDTTPEKAIHLDAQVLIYPCVDGTEWLDSESCGFFQKEACLSMAASLLAKKDALLGGPGFKAPPTLIVASTGDKCCPPAQHTDPYVNALKTAGVPHKYVLDDFGDHGFHLRHWTGECAAWLKAHEFHGASDEV